MVIMSSKRRVSRLSKMILSSSVGVGGGVRTGMTVMDEAGDDSINVGIVVPAVVSGVVIVGVGVVGLRGAALPSVALVLSVSGTGFTFLWWVFACWAWKGSIFLRLLLLAWSHREACIGIG